MLEVKNLSKIYSTKGGVKVKALDDVSVQFPEKGMVFLLGRSGSGKSTLLNVAGGLDKPDGGEVIVKGKSSKDFSGSDFDSYRNTFIGFIFQEYNILNEFTVEQNIALALQLQGKPNDKNAVNNLLEQVDLKGFGKRKPNTLSGGQKQRIAIARALIKEPEIIMADEPTGALDSNTGKQVLDTLKKLSETKLVIIVSHDREFAEFYGDRIIELKDGKILTDNTKTFTTPKLLNENIEIVSEDTVSIKNADKITDADVKSIVAMLKKQGGEAIITASKHDLKEVKRVCKISEDGTKQSFTETKQVDIKEYNGAETKFIKSKLPVSHAFKMGASGLKTKPLRLIFTILLSVVAFTMFGVLSTFMFYDKDYSISEAMKEANYPSLVVENYYNSKSAYMEVDLETGEISEDYSYENQQRTGFTAEEVKAMNQNDVGLKFAGIFDFTNFSDNWSSTNYTLDASSLQSDYYSVNKLCGFTDCGEEYLTQNGFSRMAGKYPTESDEIAVSNYVYEMYKKANLVSSESDMLNKKINISTNRGIQELKIVGIYNVGTIPSKYDSLKEELQDNSKSKQMEREKLSSELQDMLLNSFYTLGYVSSEFYDAYAGVYNNGTKSDGIYGTWFNSFTLTQNENDMNNYYSTEAFTETQVKYNKNAFKFYDLNGNKVDISDNFSLGENDVYLPIHYFDCGKDVLNEMYWNMFDKMRFKFEQNQESFTNEERNVFSMYFEKVNNIWSMEQDFSDDLNAILQAFDRLSISYDDLDLKYTYGSSQSVLEKYITMNREELSIEDMKLIKQAVDTDYQKITGVSYAYNSPSKYYFKTEKGLTGEMNIKGFYAITGWHDAKIISDAFVKKYYTEDTYQFSTTTTKYVMPANLRYNKIITPSNNTMEQINFMYAEHPESDTITVINNSVFEQLSFFISLVEELQRVFLIVGIIVGVFAALMLLNFISISITAKRKDIGILRAVGARGTDVFRIFFAEALIIAIICFVVSVIASGYTCSILNNTATETLSMKLLNFNIVNVALILVISMGISFIATFFPVWSASKKSPVDSIRAL